jgi:hypothetical protein
MEAEMYVLIPGLSVIKNQDIILCPSQFSPKPHRNTAYHQLLLANMLLQAANLSRDDATFVLCHSRM